MLNCLVALVAAALVAAVLSLSGLLRPVEAAVPAVLVAVGLSIYLARRSFRALEQLFAQSATALQGTQRRTESAIATLEQGYRLARWQFGIRAQIDTQIGIIYFLQQDFTKSLPYLQRSLLFGHWLGGAMLAVAYYKKKDTVAMRKTLDVVTRRAKKQGLAWCLYAYLLMQVGERDAAQHVLTQGVRYAGDDPRVKEALLAVQNGKKIKMRGYKEQWYQFHLERPPIEYQQGGIPVRMSRAARRGRWS